MMMMMMMLGNKEEQGQARVGRKSVYTVQWKMGHAGSD